MEIVANVSWRRDSLGRSQLVGCIVQAFQLSRRCRQLRPSRLGGDSRVLGRMHQTGFQWRLSSGTGVFLSAKTVTIGGSRSEGNSGGRHCRHDQVVTNESLPDM